MKYIKILSISGIAKVFRKFFIHKTVLTECNNAPFRSELWYNNNRVVDNSKIKILRKGYDHKMKKAFRKITASIAAAVMFALPAANSLTTSATANANARFTYRKVFAVSSTKNIDHLVFGVACRSAHTDAPTAHKIGKGTLSPGGSGAPGVYNGGGTFYPTNKKISGGIVSVHMYCDSASDYQEIRTTNYAYSPSGALMSNAVSACPTFLVGDLDLDGDLDNNDFQILCRGVQQKTTDVGKTKYEFSYFEVMNVHVGNTYGNFSAYSFDINDDGVLSNADITMLNNYFSNSSYKLPY